MIATTAGNLAAPTWVAPTSHLAGALRRDAARRLCAGGSRAWVSAEFLAFDAWLENATRPARRQRRLPLAADFILSDTQTRALWLEAIRAVPGTDPAQGELLARLAIDAHTRVAAWQLDQLPATSGLSSPEQAAFRAWRGWFSARCGELRAAAPADLLSACVAAGFRPTTVTEFRGFGVAGPALTALGIPAPVISPSASLLEVQAFTTQEDEFGAASDWALAQQARGGERTVAVVCPNPEVAKLFAAYAARRWAALHARRASFTEHGPWCGAPPATLAGTPAVAHALLVLGLPTRLTHAEAAALVQSPYFATDGLPVGVRAQFAARLVEGRTAGVTAHELQALACAVMPAFAARLATVLDLVASAPRRQSLQAWMLNAQQRLLAVGWPGETPLAPTEQAAVEGLRRIFDIATGLDAVLPAQSAQGAWGHLKALAARSGVTVPVALDAIEILTIEEAAVVAPAAAWVLGLNDGAFPAVPRLNPLLSMDVLRRAGVPGTMQSRDGAYQNSCLSALSAQADSCVWSYATTARDTPLRASPALAGLTRVPTLARSLPALWQMRTSEVLLVPRDTAPAPPFAAAEVAGGVSVLSDQAACPFRAFAKYRLRAGIIEARTPGLDARERGDLVHQALGEFWLAIRTQAGLRALSDGQLQQKIEHAVAHVLAGWPGMTAPLAALEGARLAVLVREWLAQDLDRPPFEVLEGESQRELDVAGLRLRTRIDRIDRLADGRLLIIDYKTGERTRKAWDGLRPNEPQLLAYALAEHPAPLAGIAFAQVKRGKCCFVTEPAGLLKAATTAALDAQLAQWQGVVAALAEGFLAGDAQVDPVQGVATCRYCDFKSLCRVDEQRAGNLSDESEGHDGDA